MDLDYIREFVVLAEIGNFQKAADELFISQSSLSQHIKRLEAQMGSPLFNRSKYPVQLTPFGQAFRPYAEKITRTYQECSYDLSLFSDKGQRCLRIGTNILDRYHISTYIAQFRRIHPDMEIRLFDNEDDELRNMLRHNKCDLIILRMPEKEDSEFISVTLQEDPLVAVLPISHPLASRFSIPVSDLKDETILSTNDGTLINMLFRDMAKASGFDPKISVLKTVGTVLSLIQCGNGVGIIARSMCIEMEDLAIVELESTRSIYANFLFPKDENIFDAPNMFLDFLRTKSLEFNR